MNSVFLSEPQPLEAAASGMQPPTLADPGLQPLGPLTTATAATPAGVSGLSGDVTRRLVGGTSALSLGIFLERGSGFLANILAARFAGTMAFGAYSFAISTANQISTYAAGGIGATAARFSGKYPRGTAGYSTLARALTIVSLVSAALAVCALWFGAAPLAHLLHKPEFTRLLRWAALSAAGMLLLECARGFFVGQRRLGAIVMLSLVVGVGMITLLPAAAHLRNPVDMIVIQGSITTSAVVICLLLSGPLSLHAPSRVRSLPLGPVLREVWSFGFVQLAGLVGSNLAGWWVTFLIARGDATMVQMSFFGIASQLRNIAGIAPGLLTEGSYAVMADPLGEAERTPHRVMALCSFASIALALTLAVVGITIVPWGITLLYGRSYAPAGTTAAVALAIAVVHMGNAPVAARLTIVSIRATAVINTVWAVFVASAATLFLLKGGEAWQAMAIYFFAHVLSSTLVLLTLRRLDHIPPGLSLLFVFATAMASLFAALAVLRGFRPALNGSVTSAMGVLVLLTTAGLFALGRHYHWLPTASAIAAATASIRARLPHRRSHV